ncbi:MAG: helix-turn-helix domain-containing protein [Hyphomicrobiaceae bacterium]
MYVEDARQDQRFNAGEVVTGEPFIRFYAGAPIVARSQHTIGVLCVLAPYPRSTCAQHEKDGLNALAKEASAAVDAILDVKSSKPALDIKPIDAHVGKRLHDLRARRGVTRNRLAFELGISLRDVERIECGEMRMPADQLLTVSEFLAVPIADFFEGFSNPI